MALRQYRLQILYLAVGAWNTLFGYGVFVLLFYVFGGRVGASVVIVASYVAAVLSAYVGYRYLAFRSYDDVLKEFPRFSAVYLVTLIANLVFYPVVLRVLPLNTYAVQALFTGGVVIVSYLGHRHFSFRARGADDVLFVASASPGQGPSRVTAAEDPDPEGV